MLDVEKILDYIVARYREILQENLTGIYLHGSLAMGCFNPNSSDIDFLVVVKEEITLEVKRKLADVLIELGEGGPAKDFEMSVVLEEIAKDFVHPTPFILHYSKAHKERYLNDPKYICGNFKDEDLAAHITIIKNRGKCLYGQPIELAFGDVPKEHYVQSIVNDVMYAKDQAQDEPVYLILNLCRVLAFLQEGIVCSKKEGGEWGNKNVPTKFRTIVDYALVQYQNSNFKTVWDQEEIKEFAYYMEEKILSLIE